MTPYAEIPVRPRPLPVRIAVWILLFSFSIGIVKMYFSTQIYNSFVWTGVGIVLILCFLQILCIYRGKNWARWVFVILVVISSLTDVTRFQRFYSQSTFDNLFYAFQWVLQVVASFALFRESSDLWFENRESTV